MPKLFAASIALFLLLSAGYGLTHAARAIPWDCSDWQAFAHSDRNTAILESLAENRGKTLYCGVDQSDTFGQSETWAAGKDRNERDDTVYFGERGQFRGFIAAQEGWLTDGESGITGQSIATIFEFPKEERRGRRTKIKKFDLSDPVGVSSCGVDAQGVNILPNANGDNCNDGIGSDTHSTTYSIARQRYNTNHHPAVNWPARAKRQADIRCRNHPEGGAGTYARNIAIATELVAWNSALYWQGHTVGGTRIAYQIRPWSATCVKKVKGPRRR